MSSEFRFEIIKKRGLIRAGVIHTPHGDIKTPTFAAVGTHAEVKYLTPEQVKSTGAQVMLSNAYHLSRRAKKIDQAGGLAAYSGWHGPTMTDSGGFQVMSLGSGVGKVVSMDKKDIAKKHATASVKDRLAIVTDDGVTISNPFDAQVEVWTPEYSMQIQHAIGADIMMAFDELTSIGDSYKYNCEALRRTHAWAQRCLVEHARLSQKRPLKPYQALYGVLQGAHYKSLRQKTAKFLGEMDFDGYGLGGAFEKSQLGEILQWCNSILPENKPRHLLGLSKPDDIFVGVANGCDTFDCVAPTREARHGRIYTPTGDISIHNARFADDNSILDEFCDCPICQSGMTKSRLRQLFKSDDKEMAFTAASIHNLRFIERLFEQIRQSILDGTFEQLRDEFLKKYYGII